MSQVDTRATKQDKSHLFCIMLIKDTVLRLQSSSPSWCWQYDGVCKVTLDFLILPKNIQNTQQTLSLTLLLIKFTLFTDSFKALVTIH